MTALKSRCWSEEHMSKDIENWVRETGATVLSSGEPPRALFNRLKYVARITADAGPLAAGPQLLYRTAENKVFCVKIKQELVVGRKEPADLVFRDDLRLSRQHFKVVKRADGEYIEDLGSHNGTSVSGEKTESRQLCDGDLIEAGQQLFVFLQGNADADRENAS